MLNDIHDGSVVWLVQTDHLSALKRSNEFWPNSTWPYFFLFESHFTRNKLCTYIIPLHKHNPQLLEIQFLGNQQTQSYNYAIKTSQRYFIKNERIKGSRGTHSPHISSCGKHSEQQALRGHGPHGEHLLAGHAVVTLLIHSSSQTKVSNFHH